MRRVLGLGFVDDMNEEILIRFRWTADELVEGARWDLRQRIPKPVRRMFWLVVVVSLLGGIAILARWPTSLGGAALIALGTQLPMTHYLVRPWRLRRGFQKMPDRDSEIVWQLSAAGLKARGSYTSADLQWSAFTKVVRTPVGYLLYPTDQIFHWLPRHGFGSEAEFGFIGEMVRAKGMVLREVS